MKQIKRKKFLLSLFLLIALGENAVAQRDLVLDTLRLEHKRITLRARLCADQERPLFHTIALYVDGVDTAMLSPIDWIDQTVEFHNVPSASHCYFVETNELVGGWYHSEIYTISDSLLSFDSQETSVGKVPVVKMCLDHSRPPFHTKAEKDSILKADVFRWEIGGLYPFAELGALYYHDALLKGMPTWQTFPDADSLAYDAMRTAYRHDPQEFGYLYYPITHLTHLNRYLKKDSFTHLPTLDSTCYVPMPEELLEEHLHDRVDLLTPFLKAKQENERFRKVLAPMQEPSLLVPQREKPTVRWFSPDPLTSWVHACRIDGDTLYDKIIQNTKDLADPFDSTLWDELWDDNIVWPDTLTVRKRALSVTEQDTLLHLLETIDAAKYGPFINEEKFLAVFDGSVTHFEYVINGRYHHFHIFAPGTQPPLEALMQWTEKLLNP